MVGIVGELVAQPHGDVVEGHISSIVVGVAARVVGVSAGGVVDGDDVSVSGAGAGVDASVTVEPI